MRSCRCALLCFLWISACGGGSAADTDLGFAQECARLVPTSGGGEPTGPAPISRTDEAVRARDRIRVQESDDCAPDASGVRITNRTAVPLDSLLIPSADGAVARTTVAPGASVELTAPRGEYTFQAFQDSHLVAHDTLRLFCDHTVEMVIQ
ncbi:MAG: hypothetical protein IT378_26765 [Sandaracinaceae bacterium]|nr:hypothetical protein [Sandaracinaceae bacterium]